VQRTQQEAVEELKRRGRALQTAPREPIDFAKDAPANELLNDLDRHPHAFVLACLMDRQYPAYKCWRIPALVRDELGTFDVSRLARVSRGRYQRMFAGPPALHRLKKEMAEIFAAGVARIVSQYDGDAAGIWRGSPPSAAVVRRFLEFRGAGPKIATMAANILVRHFKVPLSDLYSIDISADVHVRRTLTRLGIIRRDARLEEIIYLARELNPEYPGIFDLAAWHIGHDWCHQQTPECGQCYMARCCPSVSAV
jgi:endonuclease-3